MYFVVKVFDDIIGLFLNKCRSELDLRMSVASVDLTQNDSVKSMDSDDNIDFSKLLDKPRHLNIERQRSLDEKSLVEATPRHPLIAKNGRHMDFENVFSPSKRSSFNSCNAQYGLEPHLMFVEAWDALRKTMVYFRGQPVGTIAALDNNSDEKLYYDQVRRVILTTYFGSTMFMVFVRDFVPSALAFLINGEPEIMKNFILKTLRL
ncbi:putative beta-fructofuranosidase [Helianthus annuus]|nr:putative beta-fructofuranosidase [Helianthus annuus]